MNNKSRVSLFLIYDLAVFYLSVLLVVAIEKNGLFTRGQLYTHLYAFSFLIPCWVLYFYISELYRLSSIFRKSLFSSLLRAVMACTFLSFIFFYIFDFGITPKLNLVIFGCQSFAGLFLTRKFLLNSIIKPEHSVNVSILSSEAKEIDEEFERNPLEGYVRLEHIDHPDQEVSPKANLVVIDKNFIGNGVLLEKVSKLVNERLISVKSYIDFYEEISGKISLKAINSYWLLDHLGRHSLDRNGLIKRIFDLVCVLISMFVFFPMLLLGCLIVLISDGRPIFYSQERVGKGNKKFKIYKLRTMIKNAEGSQAKWATPGDQRVTKAGKFLRKTRIDELPQIWNILKGEMSFVGPRPEREEIIKDKLEKLTPYYNIRHVVQPGVTGWAQVNYRYGYTEDDALEKLKYDLYYIKNYSLLLDLRILLRTIRVVLSGLGQ